MVQPTAMSSSTTKRNIHVGVIGAGIGGLLATIAIAHAGAKVTVLESAEELGEVRTLTFIFELLSLCSKSHDH